jgi:hypothetical protein
VRGRGRWVVRGAAFLAAVIAFVALVSLVVMSLWNGLIPSLFRGPTLQYWQAVGLLVLSRILFGGFRGRPGWHGHGRWRGHLASKWESMTPEERERLRARLKHRCGWDPSEFSPAPPAQPAEESKQQL